jgi:GT2 family glycosyltransferase
VTPTAGDRAAAGHDLSVAVIIINYNSGDMLLRCLDRLEQQTWRSFRVIVVDNASTDDSLRRAEQAYPWIESVRLECNVGFAQGNNIGAALAPECRWIACLNPDAYAHPDWLAKLMHAAQTHPEFALFGSKLILATFPDRLDGTGDIYHVSGAAWRRDHGRELAKGHHVEEEIFAPCAAAALYRRDVFDAVGGFDSDYFCYFEDVDLAFRMRLIGHRCYYVPSAVVQHVSSAITGYQSPFTVYHGHRNLVWTFFKDMPFPLLLVYLPSHLLLNLASIVLYTFKGHPVTILRAKWDALVGLPSVWRKRRVVQSRRTASCLSLLRLMERDMLKLYLRT